MNKIIITIICSLVFCLSSCADKDEPEVNTPSSEKVVFMYLPWSSNLTDYFYQNIADMETNIVMMGGLDKEKVLVFISTTPSDAVLFEIEHENGKCSHKELKRYENPAITTEEGIATILKDVKIFAPSLNYSMIIGCHGMGWLPVNESGISRAVEKNHWDYTSEYLTRYFGGTTSEFQTDISTLADAITDAGIKMEYILFDDCYMSSIEVAYELKDVADYLIASTCEVMAYGMPYATMGKHLLGTTDYKAICKDFYDFYSNYSMPCGTLSVTDLSQLEELASIMRRINSECEFNDKDLARLQKLDGYSPTIFYDFGDYVKILMEQHGASHTLVSDFESQLNRAIICKTNTDQYYTASRGPMPIYRYSGITTSDPSINQRTAHKINTKWYRATH